ncbi:hypothetical protein ACFXAF_20795 [Kitasatospora sp. NPDC059463]|uniref:hypothetical protein n=1 Tax=unclassified Kitasatospora TaxID=2633591 RepID=UPI003694E76C
MTEIPDNNTEESNSEISEPMPAEPEATPVQADPNEAIRAEIHQEYSTRLVHAELRIQAALGGFQFPDGFLNLLDSSKLLGEDGEPSADAISLALKPFDELRKPEWPQLQGAGFHRGSPYNSAPISLDARNR